MLDQQISAWHAASEASRRLAAIPGLGIITATALVATVTDPGQFRSGRQFAAWLGLTPQQHSTGGKTRLGGISKQGDRYLRRLLVIGATAVMPHEGQANTHGQLDQEAHWRISIRASGKIHAAQTGRTYESNRSNPSRQKALAIGGVHI